MYLGSLSMFWLLGWRISDKVVTQHKVDKEDNIVERYGDNNEEEKKDWDN